MNKATQAPEYWVSFLCCFSSADTCADVWHSRRSTLRSMRSNSSSTRSTALWRSRSTSSPIKLPPNSRWVTSRILFSLVFMPPRHVGLQRSWNTRNQGPVLLYWVSCTFSMLLLTLVCPRLDLKETSLKMDNTGKSLLNTLCHVGRLKAYKEMIWDSSMSNYSNIAGGRRSFSERILDQWTKCFVNCLKIVY